MAIDTTAVEAAINGALGAIAAVAIAVMLADVLVGAYEHIRMVLDPGDEWRSDENMPW